MSNNQSQGRRSSEGLGTSLITAAEQEFNKGAKPYNNPLYAGLSDTTKQGVNQTVAAANAAQPGLQNAYNWNNQFLQGGGWGQGQQDAMATVGNVGNQFGQIANDGFGAMAASARDPSLTEQQLMGVATGQAMGQNAPGYAELRQNLADDTMGAINSGYLSGGRFGSSVHAESAGKGLSNALANLDYTNYQNDIARQERALSSIEAQRQQGFQNQYNALGAQVGALGAQQGAAQSQFGMGQQNVANQQQAAAAMPGFAQALLMPGQATTAAGQVLDADAQASRIADYDLWTRQNEARTNQIAQYASILQGMQGAPGTQQQTPWWQSLLGGAVGVAGALL